MDYCSLGLTIVLDFISEQEELEILSHFGKQERLPTQWRNKIQRFGSSIPYSCDMVSSIIPTYLDVLCEKLVSTGKLSSKPDSVTVNEYLENQTIIPHIDKPSGGEVISVLSLLSQATMRFTLKDKEFSVILPPRSLVQMRDEIRYKWNHAIDPVKSPRYSIVFRRGS